MEIVMWKPQAAMAAVILALSGCAAIQGQTAGDSENILAEAGFTKQPQSAAQAATGGATLPARQLTKVDQNGTTAYEFYDPQFCRCVYVGGAQEYAKLQQLRSQRVADHTYALRSFSAPNNTSDVNLWGPWQPEGLDVK
jgi:uncharacterized protein YceK